MKLKFVFDEIEAPNYIVDALSAASSTTQREDRLIFTAMPLLLPAESSVMASLIAQAAPLRTDPELLIKLQAYNFDHRCREKVMMYINEVRARPARAPPRRRAPPTSDVSVRPCAPRARARNSSVFAASAHAVMFPPTVMTHVRDPHVPMRSSRRTLVCLCRRVAWRVTTSTATSSRRCARAP